ncbi:MAG: 50S ribosome-binding GTPase, partial [Methylococcaceae bacterium]|nr:50S ribosome-binding GTPase [Methylococcaceae bacterium]
MRKKAKPVSGMENLFQRCIVLIILILGALPWLLLALAGLQWLWQEQWIAVWSAIMIGASLIGWIAARRFSAKAMKPPVPDSLKAGPAANWSRTQTEAWNSVESICERIECEKPALDDWPAYMALFKETIETVAAHFHADREHSFLELRVPDFLRIVELLSRDLRVLATENIPGSHIVTINDVLKGHRMIKRLKKIYNYYRLAIFAVAPVNAIVNEIRNRITGNTASLVYQEMKRYLTCACVRKAGFYAIRLYSGELDFDSEEFESYVSAASEKDRLLTRERHDQMAREPLRIVVVGQTGSGKSSLINHLFGELKTAVDVVPTTKGIEPFVLEREGLPDAIIIDTGGYEDRSGQDGGLDLIEQSLDKADLIILVCIANQASRDADKNLLQTMRKRFRKNNREAPECIVALTHIDRLRPFREWFPPYRLDPPEGAKSQTIVAAMESAAKDLGLAIAQVVPLNLQDGYNVEEALIPTILRHLPEARRHQYLRCLRSFHDEKYWERIWRQSRGAGRLL